MKAWILPSLFHFSGLGIGIIMVIIAIESGAPAMEQVVAILSGVVMMSFLYTIGLSWEVWHLKRILKKNKLWQDDEIRKKDLPK